MAEDIYGIIGGGPSGIGLAKSFKQNGIPFELIEQEGDFGGVWNFGTRAGRVYESTHLISSKKNTQFSDYPMPDDYPVYPNHRLFLAYLRDMARHFGLYEHARFGSRVEAVQPEGRRWRVTTTDGVEKRYAGLFVATGLQREPRTPSYPGEFRGTSLHAADYLGADILRGKRVLVVGGGNSGCDIAVDATAVAKTVHHSTRRPYHYMPKFVDGRPTQDWLMDLPRRFADRNELWAHVGEVLKLVGCDPSDYGLPKPDYGVDQSHPIMNSLVLHHIAHGDIVAKPDVRELQGDGVLFADGSRAEVDVIVYATGYRMSCPFLPEGLVTWRGLRPELFASVFHPDHETLCFVGTRNAAGGFGNVSNACSAMLSAYVHAMERQTPSFRVVREMCRGPGPDLGQDHFLRSDRHDIEVDLWKFIKLLNFLRTKLEG
ncbi:hypothetical protein D3093_32510 (plasmid) [Azospirillum argentinense]|uniref:4-hydroxybenzoate brominase (decarboxylating) n=1 Tax=Azospirillum argentinense TaxID=2970906 RepID=A0A4D8PT10_9PROT|nr:NAD(P)-binding domain-containing protein [Azospirillum argentinense]QCN99957.1 hypothetical protein D3093_32510 [Azospirillum argentinense]